jgi:serine/threonine-protein kinase ATR
MVCACDFMKGLWTAAQTCNELALQRSPDVLKYHIGLLSCLMHLNHIGMIISLNLIETMNSHVSSVLSSHPEWSQTLHSFGIEAAWRLGRWDSLEDFVSKPHKPTFESKIGEIFSAAKAVGGTFLPLAFRNARESIIPQLAAAGMESYRRAYDSILKLHVLFELEQFLSTDFDSLEDGATMSRLNVLLDSWENRLKLAAPTLRAQEPILITRRVLLQDMSFVRGRDRGLSSEILVECGRIWNQTARLLQKS